MNILLYIMTVVIWGSTWLAITYQLGEVPITISIFYRFILASGLLFIWVLFKRQKLKFPVKDHLFFMAQGFFLFSMNYIAAYAAGQYISSGLNAIGFSMVLVFNIFNSALFFRVPLTATVLLGASSGIAGITLIFWPSISSLDLSNESLLGIFLSLSGGLLASFGNMISFRNQQQEITVMESNAYGMGYGALWMLGLIMVQGIPFSFNFSYAYVLSLIHLSVFGTIVAFGCYLTLLGRIGASKASYALVMVPLVALIISTYFENFVWETHIYAGMGLIFLGNLIILARKPAKKIPEKTPIDVPPFKKAA